MQTFEDAGFKWQNATIEVGYHTHPMATGPSFADLTHQQTTSYQSYTIGKIVGFGKLVNLLLIFLQLRRMIILLLIGLHSI